MISSAVGHDWMLLYSTFRHGMSLQTLYRNMIEYGDSPVLLFVKDTTSQVTASGNTSSVIIVILNLVVIWCCVVMSTEDQ